MTTPAIALNQFGSGINRYQRWRLSDGVLIQDSLVGSQVSNYRENRPSSGTSPVRSDKTRAPRAWTHQIMSLSAPVGRAEWLTATERRKVDGSWRTANASYTLIHAPDAIPQGMRDRALMKALLRLKDSKVDLSVMALEARKTAGMLGKFSTDMAGVLRGLRRGDLRQLGRLSNWKNIPGRYLEWCYGVRPLLQDIDGSMQKIAEAQHLQRPLRLKVVGTIEDSDIQNLDFIIPYNGAGSPKFTWRCRRRRLVKYVLTYDVPSWALKDVSELGLSNPLSTLYELTPYSFVLDWVIPVGDWLNVLDAGAFLDFKEGSLTQMVRLDQSQIDFDPGVNPRITMVGSRLTNHSVRGLGLYRSVVTSKPVFAGIPRLKKPFQLDKLAKGLALLTQVFSRRG